MRPQETAGQLRLRLVARPMAMREGALRALLAAEPRLPERSGGGRSAGPWGDEDEREPQGVRITAEGIGIVPVHGPLMHRGDWLTRLFGLTDYGVVEEMVARAFASPQTRAVLLDIDSPGGDVAGLFDLVDAIAAMRAASGKPLWAVASEQASSAAYGIASTADRIVLPRTGEVGSVGVVAAHFDLSGAADKAGVRVTLIHAGPHKVDGNPYAPLPAAVAAEMQADVDGLHRQFCALVARGRGVEVGAVMATESRVFRGASAVEAGLADAVSPVRDVASALAAALDAPAKGRRQAAKSHQRRKAEMKDHEGDELEALDGAPAPDDEGGVDAAPRAAEAEEAPAPEAEEAPAPAPSPEAEGAGEDAVASAAAAARALAADLTRIGAQAGRLGVQIDVAAAIEAGTDPAALRQLVLDRLAARSAAGAVVNTGPGPAEGESPLVARARQRAAAASAKA